MSLRVILHPPVGICFGYITGLSRFPIRVGAKSATLVVFAGYTAVNLLTGRYPANSATLPFFAPLQILKTGMYTVGMYM